MAGHRESPYEREIEQALATTPTGRLLALPFLTAEKIGSTVHAYALSKRANSLRVETAAAAWGKRGGLLVVRATGSFGALVVAAALVDGYKVKAVARDRAHAAPALPTEAEVVEGDVTRAAVH
ncbi:hypothetical protein [Streptomyces lavendulae]|uniref:hypothetical protein n=1 Tax=Streptomyces lavendulae TaxID=1914 RepID=UPI0033CAB221